MLPRPFLTAFAFYILRLEVHLSCMLFGSLRRDGWGVLLVNGYFIWRSSPKTKFARTFSVFRCNVRAPPFLSASAVDVFRFGLLLISFVLFRLPLI